MADRCEERERLQKAHDKALTAYIEANPFDPERENHPDIIALRQAAAEAMGEILEHRQRHGC